jgi:threonine 3-dehydrogenase
MQSMEVAAGATVLVSGLGPVGLGTASVALYRGARVLGLDPSPYRRELAKRLGVEQVFDPQDEDVKEQILAVNGGRRVRYGVHVTRLDDAAKLLQEVVAHRGRLAFIGQGGAIDINAVVGKGLRLFGCWHWNHRKHTAQMMATIRGSAQRIDALVTHTFPIERIREAFDVQVTGQCGKVIIHPWE